MNIPVDYGHLNQAHLPISPDIIILPSKLQCFAKCVEKSVACNPGVLTKVNGGGTYGKLTIFPLTKEILTETSQDEEMFHAIEQRLKIEIVRI